MVVEYIYRESPASHANHILIEDTDMLNQKVNYVREFAAHGYQVVEYQDDLSFRLNHEEKLRDDGYKIVVYKQPGKYFPYDLLRRLTTYRVSLDSLFPRLNGEYLRRASEMDLELLSLVISQNFEDLSSAERTRQYFNKIVYSRANIEKYLNQRLITLMDKLHTASGFQDWFSIAEEKAFVDRYSIQYEIDIDTTEINMAFQQYVLKSFGGMSSRLSAETPVLVSHAMEYMHENSEKFAVIVMDGMSEFDWNIIRESFSGIRYEQTAAFAMIPSTTSISRQCLLSNKFPNQLMEPWVQSKEKTEFTECAKTLGYKETQIGYERGYDAEFGSFVMCGAVIINDVDDMVHAQPQGRLGMYNDITVLSNQGKLASLTKRLLANGFDVYITADHGNTLCTGLGKFVGAGVDVETKSHRMVVLKDFADADKLIDKFGLIEYPKYFLPKEFDYYICDGATSLDNKGTQVMTHGGMTIDEVVVPFIKIKAGDNNG